MTANSSDAVSGDLIELTLADALRLAVGHHREGRLELAEHVYGQILAAEPDHADARHLLGVVALQRGAHETASEHIARAIRQAPGRAEFHNHLGEALRRSGRYAEAVACYERALALAPGLARARNNLGTAFWDQGRLEEAITAYEHAIAADPGLADAHYNLANALARCDRGAEAVACYERALALDPGLAGAHNNLGSLLHKLGRLDEAAACYERAVAAAPELVAPHRNLASVLKAQGRLEEAAAHYEYVTTLDPGLADGHVDLGESLEELGHLADAAKAFRRALELQPDLERAIERLVRVSEKSCDWAGLDLLRARLGSLTTHALAEGRCPAERPFSNFWRCPDPARNFEIARAWARNLAEHAAAARGSGSPVRAGAGCRARIKVGYLSGDFREHAVGRMIRGLFVLHDRNRFEVTAYSYGEDDGGHTRAAIAAGCDQLVDVRSMSTIEAARRIREDGVDILVDLAGYTTANRFEICAFRPAPTQVSYLGFPGTTGADFIDYVVTDRVVSPPEHAPFYSEKLAYLPHCFMVTSKGQEIEEKRFLKADCGLPEGAFVFCSFNAGFKIEPVMFGRWMEILRQVPDGVLWLYGSSDLLRGNLQREAETRGIARDRLIFADEVAYEDYVARLALADLALDTRIYAGGATTCEALWAGVPVVTLRGANFPSRLGASILPAAGLPELVTDDLEAYVILAVRLARDRGELAALRARLRTGRTAAPLFDTARFARGLDRLYLRMWEIFAAGETPRPIEVPDDD
jgi:protein O-GlcNAc transferase